MSTRNPRRSSAMLRRGRPSREDEVRLRVGAYIDGALEHPSDERPLSVRCVAAFVPCSPSLIYKYALAARIHRARAQAARGGRDSPSARRVVGLERRLEAATEEAVAWKRRYTEGLERLFVLEHYIASTPELGVDLDAVYGQGVLPPDRRQPAVHPRPTRGTRAAVGTAGSGPGSRSPRLHR